MYTLHPKHFYGDKALSANVTGTVDVIVEYGGQSYRLCLKVMDDLCADLILGLDFMKKHVKIIFEMGDARDVLIIGEVVCNVAHKLLLNHLSCLKICLQTVIQLLRSLAVIVLTIKFLFNKKLKNCCEKASSSLQYNPGVHRFWLQKMRGIKREWLSTILKQSTDSQN